MKRRYVMITLMASAVLLSSACAGPTAGEAGDASTASPTTSPTPFIDDAASVAETPAATEASTSDADPDVDVPAELSGDADTTGDGPVDTYMAWLAASRVPEPDVACGYLSEELIERMLEEFESAYGTDPGGCEGLTTMSAELYRAVGASAEVSIDVVSESAARADLFVTYVDGGDCGTVVLEKPGSRWIITDESEGCAR